MSLVRYPGGKTRYTDFILPTLYRCSGFSIYVEPFVGGGSVALAVAERHPNVKLILNDLDKGIWAFWDLVANAPETEFQELADRILHTRPTVALFKEIIQSQPTDRPGQAFRAFFLNRASHMGMGRRPLGGKGQTSKGKIDSRWGARKKLRELHEARRLLGGRTKVLNEDFASVIPLAAGANTLTFLDPPYYEAGNQLYQFKWTDADHIRLHDALAGKSNWVMSYDDHPFIKDLYKTLAYLMSVKYSMGQNRKKMSELLLFPRLEFPAAFNPRVGVNGMSDMPRIWIKGFGPND
jgi:DNA adenine methylase